MQFEAIYEQTQYAFEHDEIYELLTGKKDYAYQAPMMPLSVPTFDEVIFRDGIYPYYKSLSANEQSQMLTSLIEAIRKMMKSDDEAIVWWTLSVLHGQKDCESYFKTSPFKIADGLLQEISSSLIANKQKLLLSKAFLGENHANGLWGDVERICRLLKEDFEIDVLNGEG